MDQWARLRIRQFPVQITPAMQWWEEGAGRLGSWKKALLATEDTCSSRDSDRSRSTLKLYTCSFRERATWSRRDNLPVPQTWEQLAHRDSVLPGFSFSWLAFFQPLNNSRHWSNWTCYHLRDVRSREGGRSVISILLTHLAPYYQLEWSSFPPSHIWFIRLL